MIQIYHNPRCSKSRETLKLVEQYLQDNADLDLDLEVVLYLENPPSAQEIEAVCQKLNITPKALVRTNEAEYKALGHVNDNEWSMVLAAHPKLIQRPIVVYGNKAAIGRPPEKVLEIL